MTQTPTDFVRAMLRVAHDGLTGVLGVRVESVPTLIYFHQGTPVYVGGGLVTDTLGRMLLEQRRISAEDYQRVIDRLVNVADQDREMRLGELLVVTGSLSFDAVREALASQVQRKIARCLAFNAMDLSFNKLDALPDNIGRFPCAIEPCVLSGAHEHFDRARAAHYLSALQNVYLVLSNAPEEVAQRFGAIDDDADIVARIDGAHTTRQIIDEALALNMNPYPMLTALVLTASMTASKTPSVAPRTRPPARDSAPARDSLRASPSRSMRTTQQPSSEAQRRAQRVTDPSPNLGSASVRSRSSAPNIRSRPSAPNVRHRPPAVRSRSSVPRMQSPSTGESVRSRPSAPSIRSERSAPSIRSEPSAPSIRSEPSAPNIRSEPSAPRLRSHSSSPRVSDHPSEPPARISGVDFNAVSVSEIPGPGSQRRPSASAQGQQLSRLQAEQMFQKGKRHLREGRHVSAAELLGEAALALPEALEYQLYAKWAAFRACKIPNELNYLRTELGPLAKLLAKQDRAHGLPPYVLAHLELAPGGDAAPNEANALKLFKMALRRDPKNRDAERHVRLLESRVKKNG